MSDTSEPLVTVEHDAGVSVITMRRPALLNALGTPTIDALDRAFTAAADDPAVRVLVISGEGRAFSAGADIKEFGALAGPVEFRGFIEHLETALRRLEQLPKPSIAAVNGIAYGGGLELALACDLRVVDEQSRLGVPEIKLGLLPGAGGTQRLPRIVAPAVAVEMLMTGDPIGAAEAHRIGLANEVVPSGMALERAMAIARSLAMRAPLALAAVKRLRESWSLPLGLALEHERETVANLFATEDRAEGTSAFTEKREPRFRGA
jgi:enoyl-CoA hydratase/carnithine racemase